MFAANWLLQNVEPPAPYPASLPVRFLAELFLTWNVCPGTPSPCATGSRMWSILLCLCRNRNSFCCNDLTCPDCNLGVVLLGTWIVCCDTAKKIFYYGRGKWTSCWTWRGWSSSSPSPACPSSCPPLFSTLLWPLSSYYSLWAFLSLRISWPRPNCADAQCLSLACGRPAFFAPFWDLPTYCRISSSR